MHPLDCAYMHTPCPPQTVHTLTDMPLYMPVLCPSASVPSSVSAFLPPHACFLSTEEC